MATTKAEAATARRQAEEGFTPDERDAQVVQALLTERQGYVQRGLDGRVAQVDEQIRARGGKPPASRKPAEPKHTEGEKAQA